MPTRKHTFKTGCAYHVYDKTLDDWNIFNDQKCCKAFLDAARYYRFYIPDLSLSHFKRLTKAQQGVVRNDYMNEADAIVQFECYTLMPNHYHFIIRQKKEGGVVRCMSNILNSITRYHNKLNERKGPIFLPQFRSKEIHNRYYLMDLSRYIHLNPLEASLVHGFPSLINYTHSSIRLYVTDDEADWIKTDRILSYFNSSKRLYKSFLMV